MFICEKCGAERENLQVLTNGFCPKGGKHEVYRGRETGPFHCRKCGMEYAKMMNLVNGFCRCGGKHEPV
ncbi:hypothetical protein [Fibrobacter intestinalis]|uniref:C2H2-type domain-containing protein n=1 Tax=Fibrobacter intestinalis TaxID=28122 RepID=A0A1T4REA3_9BACT|nr:MULTISPECIES: hypothetical protein [Fibrobacter]PBC73508.1 hypothetical protein BGW94_1117 [Fibrobacter sp. NR9]SKA14078.1 hypothetical protein SAMN02745108_02668 [Fibrobacter intestinalis]